MTAVLTTPADANTLDLFERFNIRRINWDFLGLVSGYKAYQIYTALAQKSDKELAEINISRDEIASIAADIAANR
ncbi:MAG: hypothetical protein COB08_002380 [Rhodobacteraceae bacterium]|nr:hypothetical protein [Paracoccaceae bacterium]